MNEIKVLLDKDDKKKKQIECSSCGQVNEYIHKHKPKFCPSCGNVHWDKIRDEFTLFMLQDNYLKNRNNNTLGKMYLILREYARKIIIKKVKGKYFFKQEELDIKCHDAANKIIEYYLTKPNFYIENSFGGYLNWPVNNVLYADRKNENHDSLNCLIDSENELEEYLPSISEDTREKMKIEFEIDVIENNSTIINEILSLITRIDTTIKRNFSNKISILFLLGLRNRLKNKSSSITNKYYNFCGKEVSKYINNALFLIYKYLKSCI